MFFLYYGKTALNLACKLFFESDPPLHANWGYLFPNLTHLFKETGEICFRIWPNSSHKLGKFVSESDSPLHANWVIKRSTFHNPQCEMAGIFATESPTAFRNITGLVFWRMDFFKTLKCNLFFLETRWDASQWWGGGRWLRQCQDSWPKKLLNLGWLFCFCSFLSTPYQFYLLAN